MVVHGRWIMVSGRSTRVRTPTQVTHTDVGDEEEGGVRSFRGFRHIVGRAQTGRQGPCLNPSSPRREQPPSLSFLLLGLPDLPGKKGPSRTVAGLDSILHTPASASVSHLWNGDHDPGATVIPDDTLEGLLIRAATSCCMGHQGTQRSLDSGNLLFLPSLSETFVFYH